MSMKKSASLITGIALILLGVALVLRQFDFFEFYYLKSYGFFIFGLLFLIHGMSRSSSPQIYFSTVFALIGLYYILDVLEVIDAVSQLSVAVYTLIFGISFYPLILLKDKKLNYLLIGNLITLIGLIFLFWHLEVINHRILITLVDKYWPVIIVLLGLIFLISSFQFRRKTSA